MRLLNIIVSICNHIMDFLTTKKCFVVCHLLYVQSLYPFLGSSIRFDWRKKTRKNGTWKQRQWCNEFYWINGELIGLGNCWNFDHFNLFVDRINVFHMEFEFNMHTHIRTSLSIRLFTRWSLLTLLTFHVWPWNYFTTTIRTEYRFVCAKFLNKKSIRNHDLIDL